MNARFSCNGKDDFAFSTLRETTTTLQPLPIKELSAIQDWKKMTTDKSKHTRWFEESNDLMHSSDGVTFAFTTQIGKGNIDAMIDLGKKQGYQIEALL